MHLDHGATRRSQSTGELRFLRIRRLLLDEKILKLYEEIRQEAPIVQNTVQALLRTMEEKGLVDHRVSGRSFIYRPLFQKEQTSRHMVSRLLDRVYDGAIDQLVASLLSIRQPSDEELSQLESLIAGAKSGKRPSDSREDPGDALDH